ncbi:hypothetical protein EVAR_66034_1 [Eumeta japonica]|uniref:Uncharacterized protein n=1 Tax=Eumeta variegata TaxID=151549 RepID=A0A4C1Z602_EUMVA|nr:hypothetical protein EVAR_66034_1 [Eumeta japonica]
MQSRTGGVHMQFRSTQHLRPRVLRAPPCAAAWRTAYAAWNNRDGKTRGSLTPGRAPPRVPTKCQRIISRSRHDDVVTSTTDTTETTRFGFPNEEFGNGEVAVRAARPRSGVPFAYVYGAD